MSKHMNYPLPPKKILIICLIIWILKHYSFWECIPLDSVMIFPINNYKNYWIFIYTYTYVFVYICLKNIEWNIRQCIVCILKMTVYYSNSFNQMGVLGNVFCQ